MNLPLHRSERPSVSELRAEGRTHLFLTAVVTAETTQMPVHIRNLSASGALIEASDLPAVGADVSVRRGNLSVGGVVAWRSQKQAGIAFKSNIIVATWLPRSSGSKQCAIDQLVFNSRNGSDAYANPPDSACELTDNKSALAELAALRSDLLRLGDLLVQDIILVATHPEIQLLDVAIQRIDRLHSLAKDTAKPRYMSSYHSIKT